MNADALRAAQIYAQVAGATKAAPPAEAQGASTANFANLVRDAVNATEAGLQSAEAAADAAANGEASLVDVATAVSAAEVTLETAIAVRNRMIEAYQEILRMPI